MTQAKVGDRVRIHFHGQTDDGYTFSSRMEKEPIEFVIGKDPMRPAVWKAVVGMRPGEKKKVHVTADQAPEREDLMIKIARFKFPENFDFTEGRFVGMTQTSGGPVFGRIVSSDAQFVTVDANPPLSGHAFDLEIELLAIL